MLRTLIVFFTTEYTENTETCGKQTGLFAAGLCVLCVLCGEKKY